MAVKMLMTRDERLTYYTEKLLKARRPDLIEAVRRGEISLRSIVEILDPTGPERAWQDMSQEERLTVLRQVFSVQMSARTQKR